MLIYIYVMCNLTKVIDFDTFSNKRRTHCSAVNGAIGTNFNVILNDDISDLRNFLIHPVLIWCITKSVRTNHRTGMNDHVLSNLTICIDADIRKKYGIVPDLNIVAEHNIWINLNIVPDAHIFPDVCECTYIRVKTKSRCFMNEAWLFNGRFLAIHVVVKRKQFCEARVGVVYSDER